MNNALEQFGRNAYWLWLAIRRMSPSELVKLASTQYSEVALNPSVTPSAYAASLVTALRARERKPNDAQTNPDVYEFITALTVVAQENGIDLNPLMSHDVIGPAVKSVGNDFTNDYSIDAGR